MKRIILVMSLFFTFSAFSSTQILKCSDSNGHTVEMKTIISEKVTTIEFNDMKSDRYSFKLEFKNNVLNYIVYEMNSGLELENETINFSKGDILHLVNGHNCQISN